MDLEPLLTEKQAAKLLGVSPSWLQKRRSYGYGPPFIRLGGRRGAIRYQKTDLDRFIADNLHRPGRTLRVWKAAPQLSTTDHLHPGPASK